MTRRQALDTLAWITAVVVVGAGVLAALIGRSVSTGLDGVGADPARGRSTQESSQMLADRVADIDGVADVTVLDQTAAAAELDTSADWDATTAWIAAVCRSGSSLYARSGLDPVEPPCLVTQGSMSEWVSAGP